VFYYLTDTKSLERFLVGAVADKSGASFLAVEYLLEKGDPTQYDQHLCSVWAKMGYTDVRLWWAYKTATFQVYYTVKT